MKKLLVAVLAAALPCIAQAQSGSSKSIQEANKFHAQQQREAQQRRESNNRQVDRQIQQNRQAQSRPYTPPPPPPRSTYNNKR